MGKTSIEWVCDEDGTKGHTWNPVTGCQKVSPGCDHCYAETIAERFRGGPAFANGFDVQLRHHKLTEPLRWRKPSKVFVNSMSDLFHDAVPAEYIAQVWAVMALAPQHTFQVLTKRHGRMRSLLNSADFVQSVADAVAFDDSLPADGGAFSVADWPLRNVWLGVSSESQQWADLRIPALLDTPAAVRFVSAEPLLGPIDLTHMDIDRGDFYQINALTGRNTDMGRPCRDVNRLDWLIVGGESGRGARPMQLKWVRSLRDQCTHAGVPLFMKQAGTVLAREWGARGKGAAPAEWPEPFPRQYPTPVTAGHAAAASRRASSEWSS